MGNFNLSKLSSLSTALTPKEEAKLVIGYFVKQDNGEGNFENEIQTIVDTVSPYNNSEYKFYWQMYMNTQQTLLDYQTTYLRLQVQIGHLSNLQYFMKISPLLTYASRLHRLSLSEAAESEDDEEDVCQRIFELLQVIKIAPEVEKDFICFSNDELKTTVIDLHATIQGLLQMLINYRHLFCQIEEKVFDGMEIIARKGLWQEIDEYIERIVAEQNNTVNDFIVKHEALSRPGKASFEQMPNLLLKKPQAINDKWIAETFEKLIGYAERDSRFNWK